MTDYTLFPIPKADVDWALYHLVAHFLKHQCDLERITEGDGLTALFKPLDDDAAQNEKSFCYHLVFPDEDLTVSYPKEVLEEEAVILKCFFPIEHVEGDNPFLDPDDPNVDVWYEDVPLEYFHYTGNGNTLALKLEHNSDMPTDFPSFVWNGDTFAEAIIALLDFLRQHNLDESPWVGRLQMAQRMLEEEANELHILHNAGLYDYRALWAWLRDKGIPELELDGIRVRYVSELKRYAMFVLNELNWHWGDPVDEHDREKRIGVYRKLTKEQAAAILKEKERRKGMSENRKERPLIQMPTRTTTSAQSAAPKAEPEQQTEESGAQRKKTERKVWMVIGVTVAFLFAALTLFVLLSD